ncbi:MAG: methionine adenosyltransferase domain-containing protein [Eggerthellaceae bacterium]
MNPTGRFVVGGPMGDASPAARSSSTPTAAWAAGGGAFSSRTARRWTARRPMRRAGWRERGGAGLAARCEVQVAYAIGMAKPVSVMIDTFGTTRFPGRHHGRGGRDVRSASGHHRRARPAPPHLPLDAAYGHFGTELPEFTWERTDKADELRRAAAWRSDNRRSCGEPPGDRAGRFAFAARGTVPRGRFA